MNTKELLQHIITGDFKTLARVISKIENENADDLLKLLPSSNKKIIGITGPPGAGKSTLVDCLIAEYIKRGKKVGVLCVDPSSAFTHGALLGDRIRMNAWFNHPDVYIRSLATRGNIGGLPPFIIEITDVMKASPLDKIIIETVGVGQTETEVAALADTTVVVLVPESGDEIQTMKAGLMEVADIFVINKYDRPGAAIFYNNLMQMLSPAFHHTQKEIPVLKTIASQKEGIHDLFTIIVAWDFNTIPGKKLELIADKIWSIIQHRKMKEINREELKNNLLEAIAKPGFNMYHFAGKFF